jgi:hypothetical protein
MAEDSNDPWAALPTGEALRRVRHCVSPRWEAWTVTTTDEGIIWCARRLADGALTHGDQPGRLLEHIADADDDLARTQRGWA